MPLCFSYETTPHRDTYESSRSTKTDYQDCRGGERPAEVRGISRSVRYRTRVRTDLRRITRDFHVARCGPDSSGKSLWPKLVRCDGEPEGDAAGSAHYRDRFGSRRRNHSEGDR